MDYKTNFNEYDQNWNLVNSIPITGTASLITVNDANGKKFFVTTSMGILKLNSNFNILNSFLNVYASFYGLTYNSATDHILVTSSRGLYIFDPNLTLIKIYNLATSTPTDIEEFNGKFYVSTANGMIYVLTNEISSNSFQTACTYIRSIAIDNYGYIAVLCSNSIVYVYNTNGGYMNIKWMNSTFLPNDMSFDAYGAFFLTGPNGIYYLHLNETNVNQHTGAMLDNSCIVASMFNFYF